MATLKKDIEPDLDLAEEGEEASLPQVDETPAAGEEFAPPGGLAAGRAAILAHARHAPSAPGGYRTLDGAGEVLDVGQGEEVKKLSTAYADPSRCAAAAVVPRRVWLAGCRRRGPLCRQGEEHQETHHRLCASDRSRHPHRTDDRRDRRARVRQHGDRNRGAVA